MDRSKRWKVRDEKYELVVTKENSGKTTHKIADSAKLAFWGVYRMVYGREMYGNLIVYYNIWYILLLFILWCVCIKTFCWLSYAFGVFDDN